MLWKGRRQSSNVEDLRGRSGRKIGFRGGIVGTIILAVIILLLGGNPLELLNISGGGTQMAETDVSSSPHEEEMVQFVKVVLADIEDVWNGQFNAMGKTYVEPKLVLYRDEIQSACGISGSATGPFYCPGDEKVYIDLGFLEVLQEKLGAQGDFAVAYILAHEVGHHVQNLLGTMDELNRNGRSQKGLIRLELQADFLAGFWIHHGQKMKNFLERGDLEEALNAAAAVGDDRIQMKTQGRVMPDSFTHGTSEQRVRWLKRGIETGDLNQGDTFGTRVL